MEIMMKRSRRLAGGKLTTAERQRLRRLVAQGATHQEVATKLGCCAKSVQRVLIAEGGLAPRNRPRPALRLSVREREEISRGLQNDESFRQIAAGLGRSPSTVSREVGNNGGRCKYRAWRAEETAMLRARRPKLWKLQTNSLLRAEVSRRLLQCWSPQQIANRLRIDHSNAPDMHVSHETIYRSLYVQARGGLRKELQACLRSGRTQRKPRKSSISPASGRIREMVMIRERPAEVEDRAVPGHWEGDLIMGKKGLSAIATLVERTSRFVMLVRLGESRKAEHVSRVLARHIKKLPEELRCSLTWDQGKEMADHVRFRIETGLPVYFCDPYSPWQRGTNENTNGLLRQYLPRSEDLSDYSQAKLNAIARELNGRPRQTLGWMTPSEKYEAVLR